MSADTIAAVATAPGEGGIGIVRVSGPDAERVLAAVFRPASATGLPPESHRMRYGRAVEGGTVLDECMAVLMRAPRSYTREDVAEIHVHGGGLSAGRVLEACLAAGARLAEPGEFTRRAFLNGRIDLAQAEAVMAVISARGEQARLAAVRELEGGASEFIRRASDELYGIQAGAAACIDYPEEVSEEEAAADLAPRALRLAETLEQAADERAARVLREGLRCALAGRPNVGKSSLLNALLREDVAIVTPVPGTTRDTVRGELSLDGALVRLTDTAGLRETEDPVERIGVERARRAADEADLLLAVLDGSEPLTEEDRAVLASLAGRRAAVVINKADLPQAFGEEDARALAPGAEVLRVSARDGASLAPLRALMKREAAAADRLTLTQPRHIEAARRAARSLRDAAEALRTATVDLASVDLLAAQTALGEITGDQVEEKLLDRVFSTFCVGK